MYTVYVIQHNFYLKNARHVSNQFMVHLQGLTFLKLRQLYIIYFNLHFNVYHEYIADVIWERWAPEDEP
jgi:hypothetical protein